MRYISVIADVFLNSLFPKRCPICRDIVEKEGICKNCILHLKKVQEPFCLKCGKHIFSAEEEYCFDCMQTPKSYEYGMPLLEYEEDIKKSVLDIKYHNKREYIPVYAKLMAEEFGHRIQKIAPNCLLPIPIHSKRRRQRGFNQAELLAKSLGKYLDLPVRGDILYRKKDTKAQKELSPQERLQNLSEAFYVEGDITGIKKVILIDDIYTTGSTIEACTRVLKQAGVEQVYYMSICIGKA